MRSMEDIFDCPLCGWHGRYGDMSGMMCGRPKCHNILEDSDRENLPLKQNIEIHKRIKEILLS